jgi:putative oxidoreductase
MKIVTLIARILLGLVFVVFGLNKFHEFIPSGPLPTGAAGEFLGAMVSTKYLLVVGLFEVAGGIPLLVNRFVPVGLCLLGPVIVNILLVDILMAPKGLGVGIVVTLLWLLIFWSVRGAFSGIFHAKVSA